MEPSANNEVQDGVAIIGMAGRFPGAKNVDAFWQNLVNGVETISRFRDDELEYSVSDPESVKAGIKFVKARAILDDVDLFDASFFGIYPKDAETMDPQHRVFLECAWEALEHAGHDPETYKGLIGLYAGASINSYLLYNLIRDRKFAAQLAGEYEVGEYQTVLGNDKDYLPTRVAYKLNLKGPTMAVQSACSTSLVAVCQAVQALLSYQCDMFLAGGVSISFPQKRDYRYIDEGMVSPDGRCRPFDASAQGTVFGNGAAVVVLKRLADAIADGDTIYGVIKGSAVNNDGSLKVGYTAPSVDGQAAAISLAQAVANVNPETISCIEAHGTGTPLGDPIEMAGLIKAFSARTKKKNFCAVTTAKGHVGHLEVAAGVTGLIKTAMSMHHRLIPPVMNFSAPNPNIDFANSPFYINTKLTPWETKDGAPRRAGVSSFGVGGTNSHVILEEAPAALPAAPSRPVQLLVLAARTETALQYLSANLAAHLEQQPALSLADVAYTLQVGRRAFPHRRIIAAATAAEAVAGLRSRDDRLVFSGHAAAREPQVVFLFPGQGAQSVGMGRELYEHEPVFRREVDRCAQILQTHLGVDIRRTIYPDESEVRRAEQQINETWVTQPAIFVVEYALACLWMSWGIKPSMLIGHSIGEYVAAVLAQAFTLDNALALLAARARLMQALPSGSMMAVRLGQADVEAILPPRVSLAAVNSPNLCTVSGPTADLEAFKTVLDGRKVAARFLATSHAFHSAMMDPLLEEFTAIARRTPASPPKISWLSTCTGVWVPTAQPLDGSYWAQQLRQTVRFSDALGVALGAAPEGVLLEVGPGQTLSQLANQHPAKGATVSVSTLGTANAGRDLSAALTALGRIWIAGVKIDWAAFHAPNRRLRVPLPTYPFERKKFWIQQDPSAAQLAVPLATPIAAISSVPPEPALREAVPAPAGESSVQPANPSANGTGPKAPASAERRSRLCVQLRKMIKDLSGVEATSDTTPLVEMGFDSLFLTQASQSLQGRFGVKVTFRQMLDELPSIEAIAQYLDQHMPPDAADAAGAAPAAAPAIPTISPIPVGGATTLEQMLAQQMQLLQAFLAQKATSAATAAAPAAPGGLRKVVRPAGAAAGDGHGPIKRFGPYRPLEKGEKGNLTPRQQKALDDLIARYLKKTGASKRYTIEHRPHLADPRAVAGFKANWKEMVYPIVATHSKGSKIWDLDGNEYIDITMGFGTYFFGHSPDWVIDAVREQLKTGIEIGPQSPLAGKVAKLVCDFTGMERATFCNTGSEAVMAAMRLARCVTGRSRIVYFTGDYHGMFEEVLVRGTWVDGVYRPQPVAPGIPESVIGNMLVLEYGTQESLEIVKAHADEIAAVMVEPVQSRRPSFQPRDFLRELRMITEQSGAALIFDEVVTGFRCHPGGAQAHFGVQADMATYGKVIGGGIPIGVLAGKSRFMDALDGGMWNYGDDSSPEVGMTFFAGTFVRHPMALAAAWRVLNYLRDEGPKLQLGMAERVGRLCRTINEHCQRIEVPIRLSNFGPITMIEHAPDLKFISLLWYYLRERGIHFWENRVCYFTLAHTNEDFDRFITVFQECIAEMQAGGFLPETVAGSTAPMPVIALSDTPFPRQDTSPLTEAQREIFLSTLMGDAANCAFNESGILRFDGPLNTAALEKAVTHLFERHPALRSTFSPGGDAQIFPDSCGSGLVTADWSGLEPARQDKDFEEFTKREMTTPFVLQTGPLIRFSLFKFGPGRYRMVITAHHLVCDGWSMGMVVQDISRIYNALNAERIPLLPTPVSFADFARQMKSQESGPEYAKAEAFWLQQFIDDPPALALPTDRPRPWARSYSGDMVSREMDRDLFARLKKATPRLGGTVFTTLFAAFTVLLRRLSGQEEFVVGLPAAGQTMYGCDDLVGHCLNFLPVRQRIEGGTPFVEFARKVKKTVLDAYEHQNYTYGTLMQKLKTRRDPNRTPLVSAMFNIDKSGFDLLHFDGLDYGVATNPKRRVNFDLFFNLVQTENGLEVECEYNTDIYGRQTIQRWLSYYEALVASIVQDGQVAIDTLSYLPAEESKMILGEWNETARALPEEKTLPALFEAQVARSPDAVAVEAEGQQLTYRQLDERASQLGRRLRTLGVGPNVLVAVSLGRTRDMLVALLGVLKAGGAYVPIDPDYPADRRAFMLEDAGVPVVLTQLSLIGNFTAPGIKVICLDRDWDDVAKESKARLEPTAGPNDLAYTLYTSGSTGKPKGVQIEHLALANFLLSMQRSPGLEARDVLLAVTTLSFDIAGLELYLPLITGAKVVLASRETAADGEALLRAIAQYKVTVLQATPSTWRLMMAAGWDRSPRLKALCGGEALPADLAAEILPRCAELWNMYGPTETTIWSTCTRVFRADDIHIGRPIDNTEIYILDSRFQPLSVGVAGELLIGGTGLARGYLKRPELTAEKFIPHPFKPGQRLYRTGDLARYRKDGAIDCLGRLDFQVKIRGFRIELDEIQAALAKHSGVVESVVTAQTDASGESRLVAYYVPQRGSEDGTAEWGHTWELIFENALSEVGSQAGALENIDATAYGWTGDAQEREDVRREVAEWIETTVSRLDAMHPRHVLEIGCGTGQLLLRLAPRCKEYVGADITRAAINALKEQAAREPDRLGSVRLLTRPADDFSDLGDRAFDTVVINSVSQYFPSAEYLRRVIEGSVRCTKAGGRVFVGDVQSFALLECYHVSTQLTRATDSSTVRDLRQTVAKRIASETELMLDPEYFLALKGVIPRITAVDWQLRRGFSINETTQFHYDAIIHVDSEAVSVGVDRWLEWGTDVSSLDSLANVLAPLAGKCVGLKRVPNQRLVIETAALTLVHAAADADSISGLKGKLSQVQRPLPTEEIWRLGEKLGFEVVIRWSGSGIESNLDVIFAPARESNKPREFAWPVDGAAISGLQLANVPAGHSKDAEMGAALRQFLLLSLPRYMVPALFVALERMPHTPNGKIDRKALPAPGAHDAPQAAEVVAPRNPTEAKLVEIWKAALSVERLGVTENFFDVGGHSLLAVRIFAEIERQFGEKLPLAVLFENPTIESLAKVIQGSAGQKAAGDKWSPLVPIQTKGNRPPLFLVHGAGGNVLLYRVLAQRMPEDQPFYGLQSLGLDGTTNPLTTVEEMASAYLPLIRQIQPHGPYYLGGYCMGGLVAYEMAGRLKKAGEEVALVALLDTYNISTIADAEAGSGGHLFQRMRFHLGNLGRLRPGEIGGYLKEKVRIAKDGELANILGGVFGSSHEPGGGTTSPGRETVQETNDHAATLYRPATYPGRVTVFKPEVNYASLPDVQMGWGDLAQGGVEVVALPVNPHAMLVEPFVQHLAKEFKNRLSSGAKPVPAEVPPKRAVKQKK